VNAADAVANRAEARGEQVTERGAASSATANGVAGRARLIENLHSALYNLGRNSLPDSVSNPSPAAKPRRWSIVAAGLLLLALALVVIYTSHSAFLSPLALVVVAAIGLAALLLQIRFRKDMNKPVRAPLWLNVLGLICAVAAVSADIFHLSPNLLQVTALGAVICFGISGTAVLHALHKKKA
jgi:peptidoglycan/LPS O-acetylase OafA/YrhL